MKRPSSQHRSRFSGLLAATAPADIWDVRLFELGEHVVGPTKGSIVPDWLLIVPQSAVLTYSKFASETGLNPYDLISEAAGRTPRSEGWLWFEHGPASVGSSIGCGVDHAHIHLLYAPRFTFEEFSREVLSSGGAWWETVSPRAAYRDLADAEDYYVFGNAQAAMRTCGVNLGSQFFRRVVATLVNRPDEWDYRQYPHVDNVVQTLQQFETLRTAA